MKVRVKRFDKDIPLPVKKTDGAAGWDLCCREEIKVAPGKVGYFKLNVAMEIPGGFWGMLAARSSIHKLGLMPVNGFGIMDSDYCGDNDEWILAGLNFTDKEIVIEKGTRVAQMMILKHEKFEFEEVDKLGNKDRGKFGTTGVK
jgi:dUTP pyrophosphatase